MRYFRFVHPVAFLALGSMALSGPQAAYAQGAPAAAEAAPAQQAPAAETPKATDEAAPAAPAPAAQAAPAAEEAAPSAPTARVIREARMAFGSDVFIMVYSADTEAAKKAMDKAFAAIAQAEKTLSEWQADSDIAKLNGAAGNKKPVAVAPSTLSLLQLGKMVGEKTEGRYALTEGALSALWDFRNTGDQERVLPTQGKAAERTGLVDDSLLEIQAEASTAMLKKEGMAVSVTGLAKGHALDRAIDVLSKEGFGDALVFIDGDIKTSGTKGGKPWLVGVQDPRAEGFFAVVSMLSRAQEAIANAGDYKQFFEQDGKRYHAILDPKTGYPAEGTRSVTVISDSAAAAKAYAQALFVMGPQKAIAFAEGMEGLEVIIVGADNEVTLSKGLKERVRLVKKPTM